MNIMIVEGKVDDLKKRYNLALKKVFYGDPTANDDFKNTSDDEVNKYIDFIASKDPSPTKKYTEWMIKQVIAFDDSQMIVNDMIPSVRYFHEHQQAFRERDINKYKTYKDLENAVKDISLKKQSSVAGGRAKKIFENQRYLLVRPDDKNAVMKYGSGTQWCITMANANYYDEYVDHGVVFYFFVDKKADPDDQDCKIAMAINRDEENPGATSTEYFDAKDTSLEDSDLELIGRKGFPIDKFITLASKDLSTAPKSLTMRMRSGDFTMDEISERWYEKTNDKHLASMRELCEFVSNLTLKQQFKFVDSLDPSKDLGRLYVYGERNKGKKSKISPTQHMIDEYNNGCYVRNGPYKNDQFSTPIGNTFLRLEDDEPFLFMMNVSAGEIIVESPRTGERLTIHQNENGIGYVDSHGRKFSNYLTDNLTLEVFGGTEHFDEETGEITYTFKDLRST